MHFALTLELQRISSFDPFGTIPCPFGRKCSMSASTMCSRTMYLAHDSRGNVL